MQDLLVPAICLPFSHPQSLLPLHLTILDHDSCSFGSLSGKVRNTCMSFPQSLGPKILPERQSWWNSYHGFYKVLPDGLSQQITYQLSFSSTAFPRVGVWGTESLMTALEKVKLILQFATVHPFRMCLFLCCELHLQAEPWICRNQQNTWRGSTLSLD